MNDTVKPIKAEYRSEETVLSLLSLKKAHQASLNILTKEITEARRKLALKMRSLRKRAHTVAKKNIFQKTQSEISFLIDSAKSQYEKCIYQSNLDCLNLALTIAKEVIQAEVEV